MTLRVAKEVVRGSSAVDGAGVNLRRVLGYRTAKTFDPFIMLDGFDSTDPVDYMAGFPWHPHRGIETLTYLIQGQMEHQDSLGNKGVIQDLSAQWMTAGSGILHQEMPKRSERMLGLQLWINLPRKYKMTTPRYLDIQASDVPIVSESQATIRLLAGSYKGCKGYASGQYFPVTYIDVEVTPSATFSYDELTDDLTAFIYLAEGSVLVDGQYEQKGCAIRYVVPSESSDSRSSLLIQAGDEGARFIFIAGKPLREPISWGGPIVMNSDEELREAFAELEAGTFIKHQ